MSKTVTGLLPDYAYTQSYGGGSVSGENNLAQQNGECICTCKSATSDDPVITLTYHPAPAYVASKIESLTFSVYSKQDRTFTSLYKTRPKVISATFINSNEAPYTITLNQNGNQNGNDYGLSTFTIDVSGIASRQISTIEINLQANMFYGSLSTKCYFKNATITATYLPYYNYRFYNNDDVLSYGLCLAGTSVSPPTPPTIEDYTFDGWYTSQTGGNKVTSFIINEKTFYYARYIQTSFYFDLNGYLDGISVGNITGYGTADVYINGVLKANDCTDYYSKHSLSDTYSIQDIKASTGHHYVGVQSGSLTGTISGATSVCLEFETNSSTLSVDPNGGIWNSGAAVISITKKYGNTYSIPLPTREHYTFDRWVLTGSNGTMTSLTSAATYTFGAEHGATDILVAQWIPLKYSVITYSSPTTTGSVSGGGIYDYGSTVTLTAIPAAGFKFVQWENGSTSATRTVTVLGNTSYTAYFTQSFINYVYIGNRPVSNIYVGEQEVTAVYIGINKIYGSV